MGGWWWLLILDAMCYESLFQQKCPGRNVREAETLLLPGCSEEMVIRYIFSPADSFLDVFNTSRGTSLGFSSSLNLPLLLSLSVLSHCEIPKLPPPCMYLEGRRAYELRVTCHRACCEVMQQGLSPSLEYHKKGQCHQRVTYSSLCLAKAICWSVSIFMALRPTVLPAPDLSHCSQGQ